MVFDSCSMIFFKRKDLPGSGRSVPKKAAKATAKCQTKAKAKKAKKNEGEGKEPVVSTPAAEKEPEVPEPAKSMQPEESLKPEVSEETVKSETASVPEKMPAEAKPKPKSTKATKDCFSFVFDIGSLLFSFVQDESPAPAMKKPAAKAKSIEKEAEKPTKKNSWKNWRERKDCADLLSWLFLGFGSPLQEELTKKDVKAMLHSVWFWVFLLAFSVFEGDCFAWCLFNVNYTNSNPPLRLIAVDGKRPGEKSQRKTRSGVHVGWPRKHLCWKRWGLKGCRLLWSLSILTSTEGLGTGKKSVSFCFACVFVLHHLALYYLTAKFLTASLLASQLYIASL